MKVYFMASPRAKDEFKDTFVKIYDCIEELGHQNISDFVKSVDSEQFYQSDISKFYEETNIDLKKSDICIFEASIPSLAIGHLVSAAIQQKKPVVVLYHGDKPPFFLSGLKDETIQVVAYTPENILEVLTESLDYAKDQADTRFNFFISPGHATYLDWISQHRRVPRSVYLRNLIKRDMESNDDYR